MSKSLIQTVNQSPQTVAENGIIAPGTVVRRYGCDLRLSGNAVEAVGQGYYEVDAAVTVEPTAAGVVTVALLENGVQLPGAIASGQAAAAGDTVTLPLLATIRHGCCCNGVASITCVLLAGPGDVTNYTQRIVKS